MKSNGIIEKFDVVEKVNVKGLVSGIITKDGETADRICMKLINRGVLPVWTHRESVKLGPPLTISIDAINEAMDVIDDVISEENDG